jgi:hypothetical protein
LILKVFPILIGNKIRESFFRKPGIGYQLLPVRP